VNGTRQETSKRHHHIPQFMLRGFAGPDGRLTRVGVGEEAEVRRNMHPRRVGAIERLNSWEHADGTFDDELERVPLNRLDTFGAEGLRDLIEFARAVEPKGQLRLLDRDWEDRVSLTMHIGGLMVRSPKLRDALDEKALPTMIEHLRSKLLRAVDEGTAEEEHVRPLLLAFERPGMVQLEPGRNRHQAALVDLITTVTAAIGSRHIVSVRQVEQPLLTGSEPVVVFRDADFLKGVSCAQLLTEADPPVAFWEEREDMLARVSEILGATAGLAWAADRHTVVLMAHPESEEGCKLIYAFTELPGEALSGILNTKVIGASDWVAGAAGDFMLEALATAAKRAGRGKGGAAEY
jgi:hypothetical protein